MSAIKFRKMELVGNLSSRYLMLAKTINISFDLLNATFSSFDPESRVEAELINLEG